MDIIKWLFKIASQNNNNNNMYKIHCTFYKKV